MDRKLLDELQLVLIDERRDLALIASVLPREVLERMSLRMKEAVNMVMELQDEALAMEAAAATGEPTAGGEGILLPKAQAKRGRGGQRGAFLREEADAELYVTGLARVLNASFVDATHMRVGEQRLLSATHFFACVYLLESKRPEVVEHPTVKSFHQLLQKAVGQAGISQSFTLSQAALSNAVKEYNAISHDLFCNQSSKFWTKKERQHRQDAWEEEMQLVGAVLERVSG